MLLDVSTYIREDFQVSVSSYSNGEVDALFCHLPKMKCSLCTVYRPPSSTSVSFQQAMAFVSQELSNHQDSLSFLMGDFNLPSSVVSWIKHQDMPGFYPHPISHSTFLSSLEDLMVEHGLLQLVGEKTTQKNVLDLVLCSEPDQVSVNFPALPEMTLIIQNIS